MGKNEFLTPKAIANRIKAKGLQKLRWYCQMCQKQCRDENGFKCHCMSESHQRQMQVFGQNPTRIVDGYSEEFEELFLEHMKRSHRFSRIAATVVYNEYIADRHHVHMNSTQWATLTEFVKYLGRTADEEKMEKEIQRQIERAEQMMPGIKSRVLEKKDGDVEKKITLSLGTSKKNVEANEGSRLLFDVEENESKSEKRKRQDEGTSKNGSVLDELMKEEEKAKERSNRKDYWLSEGIVVKGVVRKVIDRYCGEIEMLENKHLLRVDQEELETVLPQIGGIVKIVNGAYRGERARLLTIDADKFCAKVQIEKGIYDGRVIKAVEYEDICKLAQ
ncbi:DNA/RNA-binding protein kin17 [Phtheirospermum japonicum]|uniref:DNA/RNA-binding protein kin17 n=1 Tax=Phtheirospermum japonicum TaxID=374723 RepID=A0A830C0J0_9LAMI|nr:DNA/RNA-binding protein kin17 [Phtheirospermum japonicum]